jgi:hypothetical protein
MVINYVSSAFSRHVYIDDLDVVGLDVKDINQFAFEMENQVELVRMLTSQLPHTTFVF